MKSKSNFTKLAGVLLTVLMLVSILAPAFRAEDTSSEESLRISAPVTGESDTDNSLSNEELSSAGASASTDGTEPSDSVITHNTAGMSSEESLAPSVEAEPAPLAITLVDEANIFAGTSFGLKVSGLQTEGKINLPVNLQFVEGYGAAANESTSQVVLTPHKDGGDILFTISAIAAGTYTLELCDNNSQLLSSLPLEVKPMGILPASIEEDGSSLTLKVGDGTAEFVDVDQIGQKVDWPLSERTKQIQIEANFGTAGDKEREVIVEIPRGYKIIEYSAKSSTSNMSEVSKIGLSPEDETKITSSVLTALDGTAWTDQKLTGYTGQNSADLALKRLYDGKIIYSFSSNCDKIKLTITLGLDSLILPHNATSSLLNAIKVSMKSGETQLERTLSANVTELYVPRLDTIVTESRSIEGIEGTDPNLGSIPEFRTRYQIGIFDYNLNLQQDHLADRIKFVISYPEGLTLTAFAESTNGTVKTPVTSDTFSGGSFTSGHVTITHDETARTVTFEYNNVTIKHAATWECYWTGEIDNTVIKWDQPFKFNAAYEEASGAVTNNEQQHPVQNHHSLVVTARKPNISLSLSGMNRVRRDINAYSDNMYPYDYMLGQFKISNDGPSIAKNLLYAFDFDENLHVRGVSLPGQSGNDYTKVVAVTNKKTIEAGPFSVTNTRRLGAGLTIDSGKLGLDDDEYLIELKAYQTVLDVYQYGVDLPESSISYFGRFQGGQTGEVSLKIYDASDSDSPIYLVGATDKTTIGLGAFKGTNNYCYVTPKASPNGAAQYSYSPGSEIYFTAKYVYNPTVVAGGQNDAVDPVIQICLPPGIDLVPGSVKGRSAAGNHDGNLFNLVPVAVGTKLVEGKEWNVYTYAVEKKLDLVAKASHGFSASLDKVEDQEISVLFNTKVSTSCTTYTGLKSGDIVIWDFSSGADIAKFSSSVSAPLNIVQKPGFSVNVGIRTLGSGTPYFTYNGTESSIAPITPDAPAQIWIEYENTDNIPYKAGSEIYLPIPKATHAYTDIFNNVEIVDPVGHTLIKTPEWDGAITGAVTISGFTTYYTTDTSYATRSTSGGIGSTWTPDNGYTWTDALPGDPSQVTMIKFIANSDIQPGQTGGTEFEISVASYSNLGSQNFWRAYQKGWKDNTGSGTWMYGGVIAGEPSMNGIEGSLFLDLNADGLKAAGNSEDFDNSNKIITAVLTGDTIVPLTLRMNADGTFRSLNANGTQYFLKTGNYKVTFMNSSGGTLGFCGVTPSQRSDGTDWVMDIPQNGIAGNHATAEYSFQVNKTMHTGITQYVGVGFTKSPIITYKAGTGVQFPNTTEYVIYKNTPKGNPSVQENYMEGYDSSSALWTLNKPVVLKDTTAIPAGTAITTIQLRNIVVTEDITATVNLELAKYTVHFYRNDGISSSHGEFLSYRLENVPYKNKISAPPPSTKNGYIFAGWYTSPVGLNPDSTNKWDFLASEVSKNIDLYEGWNTYSYTVTYKLNDGSSTVHSTQDVVSPNINVGTLPVEPNRTGYTFAGWYTVDTQSGGTEFTGSTSVSNNIEVYARWEVNTYTVKFYSNAGGASTEYIGERLADVLHGSTIGEPAMNPTRTGYIFAGWYKSAVGLNPGPSDTWDFGFDAVTGNTNLYAGWNTYSYTVTYKLNDGSGDVHATKAVVSPSTSVGTLPALPSRAGYTFAGWYTVDTETGGTEFTGATVVGNNIDIYARWSLVPVPADTLAGKNFVLYTDEVANMSKESYLQRGLVSAKRRVSGQESNIAAGDITVDSSSVKPYPGNYSVSFSSQYSGLAIVDVRVIERPYDIIYKYHNGAPDIKSTSVANRLIQRPGEPSYEGYEFKGWYNEGKLWDFGKDLMPRKILVLEAEWTPIPHSVPASSSTPIPNTSVPVSSQNTSSSSGSQSESGSSTGAQSGGVNNGTFSGADSSNNSAGNTASAATSVSNENHLATFAGTNIPLGGFTLKGVWSLLNLVLSVFCGIVFALMAFLFFGKRYAWRRPLVFVNLIMAIATILLFVITSNFSLPMVFVNHFSLLFIVLTVIQIIILLIYQRENRKEEKLEENV